MARPDPPLNVVATDGNPTVVITWDAVDGATRYTIYRSTVAGVTGSVIGITNELTWTDTLAVDGVVYWYSVSVSISDEGCSEPSTQTDGYQTQVPINIPDPPVILMATVIP